MKDNGDLIGLQKWMLETNNDYIDFIKYPNHLLIIYLLIINLLFIIIKFL